jgi:hypothetical protein
VAATQNVEFCLTGHYHLVKYDLYGPGPIGRMGYDNAGGMWAILRGVPSNSGDHTGPIIAYCGTYHVDHSAGTIVHSVDVAGDETWIGKRFVRWYKLHDCELTLSLDSDFKHALVWRRARP